MSTLLLKQATQILAGFGLIGTPHSQHKMCPGVWTGASVTYSIVVHAGSLRGESWGSSCLFPSSCERSRLQKRKRITFQTYAWYSEQLGNDQAPIAREEGTTRPNPTRPGTEQLACTRGRKSGRKSRRFSGAAEAPSRVSELSLGSQNLPGSSVPLRTERQVAEKQSPPRTARPTARLDGSRESRASPARCGRRSS